MRQRILATGSVGVAVMSTAAVAWMLLHLPA